MNHKKPTKEELEAGVKSATEELNNTPATPEPPVTPEPTEAVTPELSMEPSPSTEIPESDNPSDENYWKNKLAASASEAQKLSRKNKEIKEAVEGAASIPEPTDEEMSKEYSDWEFLTDTEKRLSRDNFLNKKRFQLINEATSKMKVEDVWDEKFDAYVDDPKVLVNHPELEGKIGEFKQFAGKPSRKAVDFEDLVLAFIGERKLNKPAPKKGQMFETGSSGLNEPIKPKDNKLSVEEGRALMKADYKKWKEYLQAGKIKNE